MFPPKMQTPAPVTPLTGDVTDASIIEGKEDGPIPLPDTDEAKSCLDMMRQYHLEEEFPRDEEMRDIRKRYLYWEGFQYLAYDEVSKQLRTPQQIAELSPEMDFDPALYAKVVNIYKAHGEIFIGALSASVPVVRFLPKDADIAEDVTSAKGYSKVSELIQRHNKVRLLMMKSLFLLYNEGFVAAYNENKQDIRFGKIKKPIFSDVPVVNRSHYCPACGADLGTETVPAPPPQMGGAPGMGGLPPGPGPEMMPETMGEDMELGTPAPPIDGLGGPPEALEALATREPMTPEMPESMMPPAAPPAPQIQCPNCGEMVSPETEEMPSTQNMQTGEEEIAKSRELIEVFGPMNVKFPFWAKSQLSIPYLTLETMEDAGLIREIYPEFVDKIQPAQLPADYDRDLRVPNNYRTDFPRNTVEVSRHWVRPWAFNNIINNKEMVESLKKKFPTGLYMVVINQQHVVEMIDDSLDEHWTITESPLSETLRAKAIGAAEVPMQDIENELTNLTLESIEFSIPETWADPTVVDFGQYGKLEARPGSVNPVMAAKQGMALGNSFFETKPASLSREVDLFRSAINERSQFVLGTYPSIFGGAIQGGSGTAKEYEMSRASALQRLSTVYNILQEWYAKVIHKATTSYVKNMQEDENIVQAKGGNFVNTWIRRSALTGQVGETEPEVSDTFPVSWSQKRDVILNLMQMKDEAVTQVITHPENSSLVASIIGVPELYIPGDDDRMKQLFEIAKMIQEEPMPAPPNPDRPNPFVSTVPITPDLDNHEIEAETCKAWLKSEVGLESKQNNPGGYANVLAHLREHVFFITQAEQAEQEKLKEVEGKGEETENLEPVS